MKPSSSTSEGLLSPLFGAADIDAEVGDAALVAAMLEVEAALAQAGSDAGLVPRERAEEIASRSRSLSVDPDDLGRAADAFGNPVVPLVAALSAAVSDAARPWVHHGATSQDVLDSALALITRAAGRRIVEQTGEVADACADLAERHRDSVMVARTLGQQAVPTTFGLKAAGWLNATIEARARLQALLGNRLAVQLGGAAGTLAALGSRGPDVVAALARRLDLAEPTLAWHTDRQRVVDVASALGGITGALGKVALDVVLLAQTEVGEITAGGAGRGGSSAMPQKHNLVDAVLVAAIARRTPGLVATLLAAVPQEHERAAGAWHSEWEPLRELLSLAGGAASRASRMLREATVHPDRMRANLDLTGGLVMAESVAARLTPALGRSAAHAVVTRCVGDAERRGLSFRDALLADESVSLHLDGAALDGALDPASWLGATDLLIDRALAAYVAAGGSS